MYSLRKMKRSKRPVNVVMTEETIQKAKALQTAETRPSLSNLVAVLIVREHARVFPNAPTFVAETTPETAVAA